MKRTAWKWTFGLSLTLLIALCLFVVGVWATANAAGALAFALLSYADPVEYDPLTFGECLGNFVGSPLFWVGLSDVAVLAVSVGGLIATRKHK